LTAQTEGVVRMHLFESRVLEEDSEYIWKTVGNPDRIADAVFLITGVAGFLGFNFVNSLCRFSDMYGRSPKAVIGLDSFILRRPAWIDEFSKRYDFLEVHDFDIARDKLEDIPGCREAAYVFHLASIASPVFYRQYPLETLEANVWGLRNLLDFFTGSGLESLLFFSSSEVYGDPVPERIPTAEDYTGNVSPVGPRACYDEAKRFGETLCWVYDRKQRLPVKIVRPFNTYGPGMPVDDRRVVADFAGAVLANRDIVIHSDGSPTRTFCYVSDALIGYYKSLFHDRFDVFNIGIDRPEISMRELAGIYVEIGREQHSYSGRVVFESSDDREYLTNNPSRRCPDVGKARRILDYEPLILVDEGVRKYLDYLKETMI